MKFVIRVSIMTLCRLSRKFSSLQGTLKSHVDNTSLIMVTESNLLLTLITAYKMYMYKMYNFNK